jgi:FMN phosphatase YigB (HAD superfamily)
MPEIRAIISDFGNTLAWYDLEKVYRPLANLSGVPPEDIVDIWDNPKTGTGIMRPSECGLLSDDAFIREWKTALFARASRENALYADLFFNWNFERIWNGMFAPRDTMCEEYVRRLRKNGYYLGMITNINPMHLAFVRKRFSSLFAHFHDVTASCDLLVQSRKPEDKIYCAAIAKAMAFAKKHWNEDIEPMHMVYIDDVPEYAKAVSAFGARYIVAKTQSQIFRDLKATGVRW